MDLGIGGCKAIVCASSKGLGKACAAALAAEGVDVVINGRDAERLEATAASLREHYGANVTPVVADLCTEAGRAALIAACPHADILVTNNGGPPPVPFHSADHDDWLGAIEANMLAPIAMIQALLPGMQERKFGRIVNITSAMVKTPHPVMALSTAARTGLTAAVKAVSKAVARDNVTINNLLPERIDTDRQVMMAQYQANMQGISYEEAREAIANSIAAGRFGDPDEFGATCAFLCSVHAGFISGQNIQVDGGSYAALV